MSRSKRFKGYHQALRKQQAKHRREEFRALYRRTTPSLPTPPTKTSQPKHKLPNVQRTCEIQHTDNPVETLIFHRIRGVWKCVSAPPKFEYLTRMHADHIGPHLRKEGYTRFWSPVRPLGKSRKAPALSPGAEAHSGVTNTVARSAKAPEITPAPSGPFSGDTPPSPRCLKHGTAAITSQSGPVESPAASPGRRKPRKPQSKLPVSNDSKVNPLPGKNAEVLKKVAGYSEIVKANSVTPSIPNQSGT
jgi:hypothetical protein